MIQAHEIRLIDADGEQAGVVKLREAQAMADEAGLDLVEIVPNAEPPVCRVMDYGKFKFETSKKAHEAKKNQKPSRVKEIKFRPSTEIGDYTIKLNRLKKFLSEGDKTKITLRFRGREIAHQNLGRDLLKRIQDDLEGFGVVEQFPKMEGRQMVMMLSPISKKK